MSDLLTLGSNAVRLARLGVRTYFVTVLLASLSGVVLASVSAYFLQGSEHRLTAVMLVLLESGMLAFFLAGRRALSLTLAEGLTSMKLGSSLVRTVFNFIPVSDSPAGAVLAPGLQTLKPGEAEQLLANATDRVQKETDALGGIKRKIQSRLLELVRNYSLLRVQGKPGEEVNLLSIRRDLEENIDERLANNVRESARKYTLLAVVGLPLLAAIQIGLFLYVGGTKLW